MLRGVGGQTVRELTRRMTEAELIDWQRYFHAHPGEWEKTTRLERQLATMASAQLGGEPADWQLMTDEERQSHARQNFLARIQSANEVLKKPEKN